MWSYTLYIYVFVEALPLIPCLQAMMNQSHQNNHSQILSFPNLVQYPWGTVSPKPCVCKFYMLLGWLIQWFFLWQRYKESISKGTRGWKERLFSPNSSVSELGSEVRRELNAKIASVSRLIERLETARENKSAAGTSVSNHSNAETSNNQNNVEVHEENSFPGSNTSATFSAAPDSKWALVYFCACIFAQHIMFEGEPWS